RNGQIPLFFELYGHFRFHTLGGDELEIGIEFLGLQGTQADLQGHAHMELAHFGLVHVPFYDRPPHIGSGGDGGTVIAVVALDDLVPFLYGNFQDGARYRGGDVGVGRQGAASGALADDLVIGLGIFEFLLGLVIGQLQIVVLLAGDDPSVEEYLVPVVFDFGVVQGQLGRAHPSGGLVQGLLIRHDLDYGYRIAGLDLGSFFQKDPVDDPGYLWLDIDLILGDDLSGDDHPVHNILFHRGFGLVEFHWATVLF